MLFVYRLLMKMKKKSKKGRVVVNIEESIQINTETQTKI